jgi:hypothetical protein
MLFNTHSLAAVVAVVTLPHVVFGAPARTYPSGNATVSYRLLPGDYNWPSEAEWKTLNSTVGGRLIRGAPVAEAACYAVATGAASDACKSLQTDWATLGPL